MTDDDDRFSHHGYIEGTVARLLVFICHDCHALTTAPITHQEWHDSVAPDTEEEGS